jgi:hypothetical protein
MLRDIFRIIVLPIPLGSDQDCVVPGFDETQAEKLLDRLAVDLLWPGPIEVDHRLSGADVGVAHASLEAAFMALALIDGEHLVYPRLADALARRVRWSPYKIYRQW